MDKAGNEGSFDDDENEIDAIICTAILFGRDESIDLKRLEERMKKGCVCRCWIC